MGRRKQQRKKSLSVTQPTLSDRRESIQRSSTECDTSSGQPPVRSAVTRAQEAVLLRALLELVVVQLAVGVEEINMAPAPTPLPNNQQGTGLSKLMSPVQDLGRSLLSFLVGTTNPSPTTTSTFPPESEPPPVPPVKRASSKRDSLTSNTSKRNSLVPNSSTVASPGRQRPPGHPAHPTATSQTPAAVRRLGGAQRPQELPIPPYKDVPISPPPPPASSQDAISSSGTTKEAAPAEVSNFQPPTANRARRKKVKKAKKDSVEPQTKSQVQQSELLQKAPDFPLQRVLCSEGEHQLCPPGAACGDSQIADIDGGQGWVTARNSVCDPPGFSDPSQDTVKQEEEGHPAPEVAAGPPVAEELVAHSREHATRAATGVGSMHGSVSTGQLTGGDTKQAPSEKEESEGGVSQLVLESSSSSETTASSVPPAPPQPAPLSHSNNGAVPVPPPPPPEGYLLEGLKSPPVSRAAEVAKGPSGTLKRNTRLTREEALLGQLSVLDDSFSSFLRTQLNITTAARDRDSVSELTDTATIRRKKERKRRNDSENSDCQGSSKAEVNQDNLVTNEETNQETQIQEAPAGAAKKVTTTEVRGRTSSNASEAASKGGRDRPISFADISEGLKGGVNDESKASDNGIKVCETPEPEALEKPTLKEIKVEQGGGSEVNKTRESTNKTDSKQGLAKAEAVFEAAMAPVVVAPLVQQKGLNGTAVKKAEKIVINKSDALYEGDINRADFTDATNKKVMAAAQPAPASHPREEIGGRTAQKKPKKKEMGVIQSSGREEVKKSETENRQTDKTEIDKQESTAETRPCVKQELSKSDSGYSGHISCGEEEPLPARQELNMEQAMRRFNKRLVPKEQAPAKTTMARKRSDTEGTTGTEDSDDSEDEDYRAVDGVPRRGERSTRSYNSRRSSTDSSEDGFNQNVRDLKSELKELEEKFRKAMVANASLDNEKCQLMFQVDLLKDQVEEGEEQAALVSKELRAKSHDYELLKRDHAESVRAVQLLQAALASQQAMLQERGLVLMGSGEEGVEESEAVDEMEQEKRTRAIVSQETANILSGLGTGPLDVRIKRLAGQRDDLQDTVRRLKLDLEEERSRSSLARGAASQEELERETKKLLDEYKFKISKSEQEIATLTANVARLESQVMRYKTTSETLEQSEDALKTERRKMQRELRDAITLNEELETKNKYLEARLDKLKTAKSNLLKDL